MYIVSISTDSRVDSIPEVQEVLTKHGGDITTRLGIHNPNKENAGVIVVAYISDNVEEFIEELNSIESVEANFMEA